MDNPLVSIIIPVYNGEKYISNILNNLSMLTYNNYEVIFVNDGSKDNSLELLRCAENINSKIKVISQDNAGVSEARNTGLQYANGEYICFIDVDDEVDIDYLNIFIDNMYLQNVEVAFCNSTPHKQEIDKNHLKIKEYSRTEILYDFLYRRIQTGVCGLLVSKKILDEHSLLFKSGYKYSEDLHMVWRVFNSTESILHIQEPMYIYKENEGSAMTKIDEERLHSMMLMKDLETYFAEENTEFYPLFKKYGVARISWALLWQAAHYLKYKDFLEYLKLYDFSNDLKKLITFKDIKVCVSSMGFLLSKRLYHSVVRFITRKYRSV
uniref:glycosyltransferase family 2 protein n=1 Tax=Agathobacter sp. TaxID=2021311 RepID=UPI004056C117